jgi:4-phytase/acid phosphatase
MFTYFIQETKLLRPNPRLHVGFAARRAGALGMNWIVDGRVDDTPPGGALPFEVWRPRDGGKPFVRIEYTAQTIDQMRQGQTLTAANPPVEDPISVPACSRQDLSCAWDGFSGAVRQAIDPAYVRAQR